MVLDQILNWGSGGSARKDVIGIIAKMVNINQGVGSVIYTRTDVKFSDFDHCTVFMLTECP